MSGSALDREWTAGSLLRFALPSVAMMIFMGLYTAVDTAFAARFVNTDALSAINIVCPAVNLTVGLGTMLGAGGSAVVSRKMGAGETQEAREDFTLLVLLGAAAGFLLLLAGAVRLDELIFALGASPRLFPYCRDYLAVLLWFLPANMLQTMFSNLFAAAGKPGLGLGLSVLAGTANIALDWFFMALCGLGVRGAALGTGLGYLIPAASGLAYFMRRGGALRFTRPRWRRPAVRESCLNGSSEMVGQLAAAASTFLFNRAMMELLGEDGVAAITILIYSQFLLNTLYIGFSIGVAPVFGFNWGRKNGARQKKVFSASVRFLAAASVLVFLLARLGGPWIARLFAGESARVCQIASEGFSVFSYSFLFCGLNLFTSALFTALSNGRVSAALSFLRTFGLLAGGILLLPRVWGVMGVWLAVPAAECVMFSVSAACLFRFRRQYSLF